MKKSHVERHAEATQQDSVLQHRTVRSRGLDESSRIADAIAANGRSIVIDLASQNETIRHANSRLHEVGGALGLSQSTMRTIERYVRNNEWAVVVSIVFIIFLFFCIGFLKTHFS